MIVDIPRIQNDDYDYFYAHILSESAASRLIDIFGKDFVVRQLMLWAQHLLTIRPALSSKRRDIRQLQISTTVNDMGYWGDSPQDSEFWQLMENVLCVLDYAEDVVERDRDIERIWLKGL